MASVGVLSPDILHETNDYLNEQESHWWQWVILKHTGSWLPPRPEPSKTPKPLTSSPRPTKAELLETYLNYLEEDQKAEKMWRRLISGLCVKLPTEIRLLVIKKYLESLFPRAVYHDHIRSQHYTKDFRPTPLAKADFDLASTQIATEIFSKLNSQILGMQAKRNLPFKAQNMVNEIIEEAVKLISKLCTYFLRANFPSRNSVTDEFVPTAWKPRIHNIRHLELTTRLMGYSSTKYYPIELFKAQDHIVNLPSWFPGLQSMALTIIEGTDRPRDYLKRGSSHQTTTLASEIEKIVAEMQKLDVPEKGIRLYIGNGTHWREGTYDDYWVERKSAREDVSDTDTDGMSCQEITAIATSGRLKLFRILRHEQEPREEDSSSETHS